MSEPLLRVLAQAAGLATTWRDYRDEPHTVSDEALRCILAAMGRPADTPGEAADSLEALRREQATAPPLVTAVRDGRVRLKAPPGRARLHLEHGEARDLVLREDGDGFAVFRAPHEIGWSRLETPDGGSVSLAIAPPRAPSIADLTGRPKAWGLAVQLYSLNGGGDFRDFGDLARFARVVAAYGADAVAVSPTHALFIADLDRYAPYGPSTRLFLNPFYAESARAAAPEAAGLIDWRRGAEAKLARLREDYVAFAARPEARETFQAFVQAGGEALLGHARFEALDARFRAQGLTHWRDWPGGFSDAQSPAVQALSPDDPEVEFHLFLQWRAAESAGAAQAAAKAAGMAIGLISDLAVGMDGAGSHAWSRPGDVLQGVSIGAPPDLLASEGQSWGLTSFSPTALRARSYEPFLATLRAALAHAGGVRIDHAIGLQRLWVSPEGAEASEGAYLAYPLEDLLRLTALEADRRGAVVIGEDLGTVPEGFRERSTRAGMAGMRVLWFERTANGGFRSPGQWGSAAAGMTTTHDLPTVAGWWRGLDLDWRGRIQQDFDLENGRRERTEDRKRLWSAMVRSGAASGARPEPQDEAPVVDAAVAHVAASACDLALVAVEDVLGLPEQPNMPGTTTEHPNWRRRLPPSDGLDDPAAIARLTRLGEVRPIRS
ncbi:MAG: 4-alpha-glucanotransferase [Caulobacteraceae bacterium]|nr:4-alpha-glucanotransferase [Caulobacteraceae bacterium]